MAASALRSITLAAAVAGLLASAAPAPTPTGPERDTGVIHPSLEARFAQSDRPVKAWVYFSDKGHATDLDRAAAIDDLRATYDPRAIERRTRRRTAPGLFDARDLPVHGAYVDAIVERGAKPHVVSRWLNAVSAHVTAGQAEAIAGLPFVRSIEPVRRGRRIDPLLPGGKQLAMPPEGALGFYGEGEAQLAQINLINLHQEGATGQGVIIGVLDTGFRRDHVAFNDPVHPLQVIAEWDFINDDGNAGIEPDDPSAQHVHGTLILGVIGGYEPDQFVGAAYDASFILCKTEDMTDEYPAEEDNYVGGLEFIETNGGDVATSSLGYIEWYDQSDLDGLTAVTTVAVNIATANGIFCCTAAGNDGHDDDPTTSHLLAPSDAFQVISCGAVEITGEIAGFSADGPTADGRVKPEVLARGIDTVTVASFDSVSYQTANGTSLSTPLVASAVACMVQAQPTWTVDQLRSMLFTTADWYVATGSFDPLYVHGYGVLDAYAAVANDCNANGVHDDDDIALGGSDDANGNGIPDECECPADVDGNGAVNVEDLLAVLAAWGTAGDDGTDVNGDRTVDVADLLAVLAAWGACG